MERAFALVWDWLRETWPRKRAGALASLIAALVVAHHLAAHGPHLEEKWKPIPPAAGAILMAGIWYATTKPPRNRAGAIGIGIAVACENEQEQKRFRSDFIGQIRKTVAQSESTTRFRVLEVKRMVAETVSAENAAALQDRMNCQLLIHGTVRQRRSGGQECRYFSIEGRIRPRFDVPQQAQDVVEAELLAALPHRVELAGDHDLAHFEATAEMVELVACYVVGIAASHSGDSSYAESLLLRAQSRIAAVQGRVHPATIDPHLEHVAGNVPKLLRQTYGTWLATLYRAYVRTRDVRHLDEFETLLNRAGSFIPETDGIRMARAIIAFACHADVSRAMAYLRDCRDKTSSPWHYNAGFLFAIQGNFAQAENSYRLASRGRFEGNSASLPNQVDEFLCDVIDRDPSKAYLRYFAAINAGFAKSDKALALEYLDSFLGDSTLGRHQLRGKAQTLRDRFASRLKSLSA